MTVEAPKASAKTTKKSRTGGRAKAPVPKSREASATKSSGRKSQAKRLRPGELNGLVLGFMQKNEKDLPMSPTTIANGIKRSSGAVGNCLGRLAKAKEVRLVKKVPRKYSLKK
jgi:predicted RNA-binding protein (virulence factor B family)